MELVTQIQIAEHLDYLPAVESSALLASTSEIGRMLTGLRASLDPKS